MQVRQRIEGAAARLTPAEQRVAEAVLSSPEAVAFGTVAALAARAKTSGPSVLRLASKLGFDGFVGLQAAVQDELAGRLRPAAERIRTRPAAHALDAALATELDNVQDTLSGVEHEVFDRVVRRLADRSHRVGVLSGEATYGVAHAFADGLGMLRPQVQLLAGSEVRVARHLSVFGAGDTIVAVDVRRYERWVVQTATRASEARLELVAITDGLLSPLAAVAGHVFVVRAIGAGPFDSHTGTLALCNALVAATADRLRRTATDRLDRVEQAWRTVGALLEAGER